MKDKASWMEAARSNPDSLTLDEFLAFTHPESSAANQLALVEELYDKFDRDGDEFLTENEFAILQTDGKYNLFFVKYKNAQSFFIKGEMLFGPMSVHL